jgi:hypothetical protein
LKIMDAPFGCEWSPAHLQCTWRWGDPTRGRRSMTSGSTGWRKWSIRERPKRMRERVESNANAQAREHERKPFFPLEIWLYRYCRSEMKPHQSGVVMRSETRTDHDSLGNHPPGALSVLDATLREDGEEGEDEKGDDGDVVTPIRRWVRGMTRYGVRDALNVFPPPPRIIADGLTVSLDGIFRLRKLQIKRTPYRHIRLCELFTGAVRYNNRQYSTAGHASLDSRLRKLLACTVL